MYTDPISDYLTRIRNAVRAEKKSVEIPYSKMKVKLSEILLNNNFIQDFKVIETSNKQGSIIIYLKYFNGTGVIQGLERISRPGIRRYVSAENLPRVLNGLGISIISTSNGLLTDNHARKLGIGGEIICNIW